MNGIKMHPLIILLTGWNEWKASLKYYEHLRYDDAHAHTWKCIPRKGGSGNVLKCARNIIV